MRTEPLAVTVLDPSEYALAGEVLGRAFQTDPLWTAVIRDHDRRCEMLVEMFTGLTKTTVAAQGTAEKTPHLNGVALWLPPGKNIGLWATLRSGLAMARFVIKLPGRDRKRMMTVLREVGERRKILMPEPHWYVAAIGVAPEFHGTGLGTILMRHGIARADRSRRPIYLETETESNVAFYQHLGFDVIEEFTPNGLSLPIWLMARDASSSP